MAGVRADGGALDSHRGEDHAETRRRKEHSLTGFHSIINVCFLDPYTAHNTLRFMGIFDNVLSNGISNIKWVKEWRIFLSNLPKIKDAIAKGTTSTMSGVSKSALALYGRLLISNADIEELAEDLEDQGGRYRELINGVLIKKDRFKDSFALGGEIYLLDNLPDSFPNDIESSYASQYPNLASNHSLSDHIDSLDASQQMGFISGLKGKLFEQKYTDYLNNGELPDGYIASLAESPTQKGWDIAIHDTEGNLDQVLQAKATGSVDYIQSAFEKYPQIDVVTTDEVYSQLVMQGVSEGLLNSGISNQSMVDYVTSATGTLDAGLDLTDFCPPIITWALIAFTSYKDPNLTNVVEKADDGGIRLGKAYFAYILGVGVTAVTNTWWLGLATSVVSRASCDEGYRRFELLSEMKKAKHTNRGIIRRWTSDARSVAPA